MRYKLYEHRYTFNGQFAYAANCIEHSLDILGHEKVEDNPDLHIYNHTCRDIEPNMPENSIIFKPTAPTGQHFQICDLGYANSSRITFTKPDYENRPIQKSELNEIQEMVNRRTNKWDSVEGFKWEEISDDYFKWTMGELKDDHILIIGQTPHDETVKGFGFGNHWDKMCQIVEKLKDRNLVIKLHPKVSADEEIISQWQSDGHQVVSGYVSIHSILQKTKVAIIENSTAGVECMMNDIPIISYGYPDYHWITKDLRILTELNNCIDDMSWFSKDNSRKFLAWYMYDYLCYDIPSTVKRLQELI